MILAYLLLFSLAAGPQLHNKVCATGLILCNGAKLTCHYLESLVFVQI